MAPAGIHLIGPAEAGVAALPEETGETFLDNAVLKASHCLEATGRPSLGDDSGLEVVALGGEPGVRSARYAGPAHDAVANTARLLAALEGVTDRRARFVCTEVLAFRPGTLPFDAARVLPDGVARADGHPLAPPGATVLVATGEVRGTILHDQRGSGGFGYDPVFQHEDLGTFAEIPDERKNELSHRGKAFRLLAAALRR